MKLTCIIDPSGEQHDDPQLLPEAPPRGSAGAASAAGSPTAAELPRILLYTAATPAGPHGRAAAEQGHTVHASAESGSSTEATATAVHSGISFYHWTFVQAQIFLIAY